MVFPKGQSRSYNFKLNNEPLEIVSDYKYLEVHFSRKGTCNSHINYVVSQATRAIYSLIRSGNRLLLPIDLLIDLFNKTVKPTLLFGVEIWGTGNIYSLENVHLTFL